ncbi:hypothetical protein [Deinococcus soli (ex Cha et al. 2016)]|uniref:Uncharacterized protein n=2 Tax=Deinococcus soli (ex Cha et al. 2016) TaxID=1309411 RepID=A0AAE3XCV4_9DEIO|nr:hypothetical protein [Deinococcus soli (ex Cha et al. 2016)]MDR6218162.1 hypothetical protein [Deinococcus soli (ex Cha et al. 2016)]MDR6328902.1 hypothetical protein [Deinococcus soli (ex Cha et al. 2016)]MDR6751610.1 hypothetical protein [Deinococcus soli (ex Cha et al. 2016)]
MEQNKTRPAHLFAPADLTTLRLAYAQAEECRPALPLPASVGAHFSANTVIKWTLGATPFEIRQAVTNRTWHVHHVRGDTVLGYHVQKRDPDFTSWFLPITIEVQPGDQLILASSSPRDPRPKVLTVAISGDVNWSLLSSASLMRVDTFLDLYGDVFTAADLEQWIANGDVQPTYSGTLSVQDFLANPEGHLMGCDEPDDDHFRTWLVRDGQIIRRDTWTEGSPTPDLGLQPGDVLFSWHSHECAGMACAYQQSVFASRHLLT